MTSGSADATYYVDDQDFLLGSGLWLYAESNGIWTPKAPGVYNAPFHAQHDLQRGGCTPWGPDVCASRCGTEPSDLLLF